MKNITKYKLLDFPDKYYCFLKTSNNISKTTTNVIIPHGNAITHALEGGNDVEFSNILTLLGCTRSNLKYSIAYTTINTTRETTKEINKFIFIYTIFKIIKSSSPKKTFYNFFLIRIINNISALSTWISYFIAILRFKVVFMRQVKC